MIEPRLDVAAEFLERWKPGGPWLLCAFHEDLKPEAAQFDETTTRELRAWIAARQADSYNVYFHVNTCREGLQKKALKADVLSVDWLHVDVDPDPDRPLADEQARVRTILAEHQTVGLPEPTLVVFSGGGCQAFWRLREPIEVGGDIRKIEDAERYNLQVERLLGADSCHNADRVMRLPGTVNHPNAKKRARGQRPVASEIVRADWSLEYPLDTFVQAVERQDRSAGIGGGLNRPKVELPSGNVQRVPPERLLEELGAHGFTDEDAIVRILLDGEDTEAPVRPGADRSRSGWFLHAVAEMVRHNVPDELIYSIVTDPTYRISEHPLGQGRGRDRAVRRAIQRGKESVESDDLARLNDEYALVESVGGQMRIMCERHNEAAGRREIEFHRKDGFLTTHNNRKVLVARGTDAKGNVKLDEIPLGAYWLGHRYRRTYRDVTFYPGREFDGTLNLWRGFNVDAVPGDCDLFLAHVRDNICRGSEEYYRYLIQWMAHAVQRPHLAGQVAVVLRGGQGTGKGVFSSTFGHLFGVHYKHLVNPDHITGQFNSVLRDAALVFADECFVAGNKRQEAALKTLITEERLRTEAKGIDSVETRNCVHLIMATNKEWSIAAEWDDRRFFALNVGDDRKQDASYFRAIREQMEAGGYEALMHRLLTMDLRDFNVRQCPKTDELRAQQDRTLGGTLAGFVLERLEDGALTPSHAGWRGRVLKDEMMDLVHDYTDDRRLKKGDVTRWLKRFLDDPDPTERARGQVFQWTPIRGGKDRTGNHFFTFPSLEKCRRLWDEQFGARSWPDVEVEPDDYRSEF